MQKSSIKQIAFFFMIVIVHFSLPISSAQDTADRFPESYFMDEWGGYISGAVVEILHTIHGQEIRIVYPFEIKLGGIPSEYPIGPYGGVCNFHMIMQGSWPGNFTFSETTSGSIIFLPESVVFTIAYPAGAPGFIGYDAVFHMAGFTVLVEDEILISLSSGGADPQLWSEDTYAFGYIGSAYLLNDTLDISIYPYDPIITNYLTHRIIIVEDVGEFIVNTNSEIVFYSETELELILGAVIAIKSELCSEQLRVNMPQAVAISCSGAATFITKVEADGTNVIIVLEGQVEFSDRDYENTVIVGQNQRSTCEQGGVPNGPESINPDEIVKWWE